MIRERIAELTQRYNENRTKVMQLNQQILQLQSERDRLLTVDHSLRGGLAELEHVLKNQSPKEKKEEEEEPEKDKDTA